MKRNVFVFRCPSDPIGSGLPMEAAESPNRAALPGRDELGPARGANVEPGAIDLEGLIAAVPVLGMEACWPEAIVG